MVEIPSSVETETPGITCRVIRGDITLPLSVNNYGDKLQTIIVTVDSNLSSLGALPNAFLKKGGTMGQDGPYATEIRQKSDDGLIKHGDTVFAKVKDSSDMPAPSVTWVADDWNVKRGSSIASVVKPALKTAIDNDQVRIGIPAFRTAPEITQTLRTTPQKTVAEMVLAVKQMSREAKFPTEVYFVVYNKNKSIEDRMFDTFNKLINMNEEELTEFIKNEG